MEIVIDDCRDIFDEDKSEIFQHKIGDNNPVSVYVDLGDDDLDDGRKRIVIYHCLKRCNRDDISLVHYKVRELKRVMEKDASVKVVGVYMDLGILRRCVREREALLRMFKACKEGKIDKIAIWDLSRMFRDLYQLEDFLKCLKKYGVGFHSEMDRYDTDNSPLEMDFPDKEDELFSEFCIHYRKSCLEDHRRNLELISEVSV